MKHWILIALLSVAPLAAAAAHEDADVTRADGGYGRRTMVLAHRHAGWKILHIHASNIAPRQ
jgi:hypothetical protein